MLVYPYIKNGVISHGKVAEMLGIFKMDLIKLCGKLGLPYFDESEEELESDIEVIKNLRKNPFYRLTANVQEATAEESKEILEEIEGLTDDDLTIASTKRFTA